MRAHRVWTLCEPGVAIDALPVYLEDLFQVVLARRRFVSHQIGRLVLVLAMPVVEVALSGRNGRPAVYLRETQLFWVFCGDGSDVWQRLIIVVYACRLRGVGRGELRLELRHRDLLLTVVHVDVVFEELAWISFGLIELRLWHGVC